MYVSVFSPSCFPDDFYNMKPFNFLFQSSSFSLYSRLNRNKLQFLPELLFQSNPKLGRLWVHLSRFFHLFVQRPHFPPPALSVPFSISFEVLQYVIHLKARYRVRTFIRVEGSSPLPWWHSAALCCCSELKKSACVSVCVPDFVKRWKGACTECFAWTCKEILFRNPFFPWVSRV